MRLLFADDIQFNRIAFRDTVVGLGWEVDFAKDGGEAVALAAARRYDMVVLDLDMPVVDGLEAARRIRATAPDLPLVALTANADAHTRAMEAGFDLFLARPIEAAALRGALSGLVERPAPLAVPPELAHLLPLFLAEMAKDTASLIALAGGDRETLAEHAHAMRGKCAMFSEMPMFELLTAIEEGPPDMAEDEIRRLVRGVIDRGAEIGVCGLS